MFVIVLRTRNLSNLNKIINDNVNDNVNDNELIEHEDTKAQRFYKNRWKTTFL